MFGVAGRLHATRFCHKFVIYKLRTLLSQARRSCVCSPNLRKYLVSSPEGGRDSRPSNSKHSAHTVKLSSPDLLSCDWLSLLCAQCHDSFSAFCLLPSAFCHRRRKSIHYSLGSQHSCSRKMSSVHDGPRATEIACETKPSHTNMEVAPEKIDEDNHAPALYAETQRHVVLRSTLHKVNTQLRAYPEGA